MTVWRKPGLGTIRSSRRADTSNPSRSERFRADIQGLRAIAVLAVVLYHGGVNWISGGYVGVDIFFVISGFLISGHLLQELNTQRRIRFMRFYARRARRILPAAFAVIVLTVVFAAVFVPPLQFDSVVKDAMVTAVYLPNYLFASRGTSYLFESSAPSLFQHYWSLGVEEQFYIVWPLLLLLGFAIGRRWRYSLAVTMTAVGVASFAACLIVVSISQPWAFFSLPTRAWEFAVGGLVALLVQHKEFLPSNLRGVVASIGSLAILVSLVAFNDTTGFPGFSTLLPVVGVAAVIYAGSRDEAEQLGTTIVSRILGVRGLVWIGTISYSLYLVHWPILTITQSALGAEHPMPLWFSLALSAAGVPIAWVLYKFVESPFRSGIARHAKDRTVVLAAVAVSVVVVAALLPVLRVSETRALYADRDAVPFLLEASPTGTGFVPANLTPGLRSAEADLPGTYARPECHVDFAESAPGECFYGSDTTAPLVLLFGDSLIEQWFPALLPMAESGEIFLQVQVKSGCPAAEVAVTNRGQEYPSCGDWRSAVLDDIVTSPSSPDLILISGRHENLDVSVGANPETWARGNLSILDKLLLVAPVILVADTPGSEVDIPTCLSAHIDDASACDVPLETAFYQAEKEAAVEAGVEFLDTHELLCNDVSCPSIIGNLLVRRDSTHVTATFAAATSAAFESAVRAALGGSE